MSIRSISFAAVLALVVSCTPSIPENRFVCATSADCPGGWVCDTGIDRCVSETPDAGPCPTGTAPNGSVCEDIDECMGADPCGVNRVCVNTDPGFTCPCTTGYSDDGAGNCVDVDECSTDTDDCSANATCENTVGGFVCDCVFGFIGDGKTCNPPPSCDLSADVDNGVASFTIVDIETESGTGFNLDGINNASAGGTFGGMGATVAGCGKLDFPSSWGIDNAMTGFASTLLGTGLDYSAWLQGSLASSGGPMTITVNLDHLVAGSPDDLCLGVTIDVTVGGVTQSIAARGWMVDDILEVDFGNSVATWNLVPEVPDASCNGSFCQPGDMSLPMSRIRGRFILHASHTAMLPGSILGGVHFWEDTSDASYATANSVGLKASVDEFASQIGLASSFHATMIAAMESARDLHSEPNTALTPCTSPTNSTSNTNKNSISFAYALDSVP